jgi:hypothetical protein
VADGGRRVALERFLADLHEQLRNLSEAIRTQYQHQPPAPQPLSEALNWGGATS